jgi:hypothetical protein
MSQGFPYLDHQDGIPWHEAPLPRRWHRCKPWTVGATTTLGLVQRCACGAVYVNGHWYNKNQRRRG